METWLRDLRFGLRMVGKRPVVTVTAALCLALGIGAATVVFSLVSAVLLRPLPLTDPERVVAIWTEFAQQGITEHPSSGHEFRDVLEQAGAFAAVAAELPWYFNLTSGEQPERLVGGRVTAGFFQLLGVDAHVGRTFLAEEAEKNAPVTMLSYRLWQRRFGGDRGVVGSSVSLAGVPYEVVGVLPKGFFYPYESTDVWVPWNPNPRFPRGLRLALLVGRLAPGVTLEEAQADLDTVARRMQADHPDAYPEGSGWGLRAEPVHQQIAGDVRPQLLILFAAVALVLFIACVNVANLLLAQAQARRREVAVRAALGARRRDLVRQLLTESLLLAALGGGLGLLLARWGSAAVVALELGDLPRLATAGLDGGVLAFAAAVSLATGVLFGLAPALQGTRVDLYDSLREGDRGSSGGRRPLRDLLVVAEVALALVVLVGAGLMLRTFQHLERVDPGFRSDGVVTAQLFLSGRDYARPEQRAGFYRRLAAGLEGRSGITAAGIVSHLPLGPLDAGTTIAARGREPRPGEPDPAVGWRMVSPEYFQVMAIPLRAGRTFSTLDHDEAAPVVIVDAAVARRLWGDADPIGRRVKLARDPAKGWRTVVGVVGAVHDRDLAGGADELVYLPYLQYPFDVVGLALATPLDVPAAGAALREVIGRIDPLLPVARVMSAEQLVAGARQRPRLNRLLFGLFGLATLALVAVGIYGVMASTVSQRRREVGLRMALGAHRAGVLGLILGRGLRLALAGLAAGLVLAFALSRALAGYLAAELHGVRPGDAATLAGAALLLVALALAASLLPAWKASRVSPTTVLREE